jgi:hypothetical protein
MHEPSLQGEFYKIDRDTFNVFIAPLIEVPVACCLVLASVYQWFGMSYMRISEPGEMVVYRKIRDMLKPGTLAFFEYQDHYMPGRMTYLLLDALKGQDPAHGKERLDANYSALSEERSNRRISRHKAFYLH